MTSTVQMTGGWSVIGVEDFYAIHADALFGRGWLVQADERRTETVDGGLRGLCGGAQRSRHIEGREPSGSELGCDDGACRERQSAGAGRALHRFEGTAGGLL